MEKEDKSAGTVQIVCFNIGAEKYGIEIGKVQEILKLPDVTPLPKSANYIMGVIDLRGRVVPIVDLGMRFNLDLDIVRENKRAIVVDIKGKKAGLAIDSVSNVIRINTKDIGPPPQVVKGISGKYIVGIGKLDKGFVVILDIDQVLTSVEMKEV